MRNLGEIWMLHSVEDDSPRMAVSEIYRNLTVPPADLERKILAARQCGDRFVTVSEFAEVLAKVKRGEACEPNLIAITIDDGFRNIYTEAFPLFKRLQVPFTFYVSTALIEHGFRHCPFQQLEGMMMLCD